MNVERALIRVDPDMAYLRRKPACEVSNVAIVDLADILTRRIRGAHKLASHWRDTQISYATSISPEVKEASIPPNFARHL